MLSLISRAVLPKLTLFTQGSNKRRTESAKICLNFPVQSVHNDKAILKRSFESSVRSQARSAKEIVAELVQKGSLYPWGSRIDSNYFGEDQEPIVNDLISRLTSSYKGHLTELNDGTIQLRNTSNKTFIQSVAINGMYGSGKTSLSFALPDLLRQKLSSATTIEERFLRRAFERPLIVDNSANYDCSNQDQVSIGLGILLATYYWFGGTIRISYDRLNSKYTKEEIESLSYSNVVKEIIADNNSKNDNERITSIYFVHDKCQASFHTKTIVALLTSTHFPELFTFSAYNGTGVRAQLFSASPELFPEYSVEKLSIESTRKIVANLPAWKGSSKLAKLDLFLAAAGGIPFALERHLIYPPKKFNRKSSFDALENEVRGRWMAEDIPTLAFFFSVAGLAFPSQEATVLRGLKNTPISAYDLTVRSQMTLRTCKRNGRTSVVLDYPMIFMRRNFEYYLKTPLFDGRQPDKQDLTRDNAFELVKQANYLTVDYYNYSYSFEELVVRHFVFRWNMHNYSRSNHVSASNLFNGGHFTRAFEQRLFALEDNVLSVAKALSRGGVSADVAEAMIDEDKIVQFTSDDPKSRGLLFSDQHVFSGHLRLREFETAKRVIVWIDAKHTSQFNTHSSSSLTSEEINEIKANLRAMMSAPSMSSFVHLVLVITDRCYIPQTNDNESNDPLDDHICIVARDGLMFGTSPWISLVAQTLRKN